MQMTYRIYKSWQGLLRSGQLRNHLADRRAGVPANAIYISIIDFRFVAHAVISACNATSS